MKDAKAAIRGDVQAAGAAVSPQARADAAARLAEALWTTTGPLAGFSGGVLLGYMPLGDEIDPRPAMQRWMNAGGRLAVPVTDWAARRMQAAAIESLDPRSMEHRPHGVLEPASPTIIDPPDLAVVLVPGVAFDACGGRLGRGAGFYDRFLATLSCPTIGVCFASQQIERVPREPHDVPVGAVVAG